MSFLVVSTSLNPESRSRILAREAVKRLSALPQGCKYLDLADTPIPFCDGDSVYGDVAVVKVARQIREARGILMATPVYNYDASATAKNLIEVTGRAWNGKVVGFLCAAGGEGSYMSIMSLANSLMLDFRCLIIPRFVYAMGSDYTGDELTEPDLVRRMDEICDTLARLSKALEN